MKNLLLAILLLASFKNSYAQTEHPDFRKEFDLSEKIFYSLQPEVNARSIDFFPDSIKYIPYGENLPGAPIYYAIKYQNEKIIRIDYRVYDFNRFIEYEYDNEGRRKSAILFYINNGVAAEKTKYIYSYDDTGFFNCLKLYSGNILQGVDSINFEYNDENKVVTWTRLNYGGPNNPVYEVESQIYDIQYEGEEITSFNSKGMVYGNFQPISHFKFRNLKRFNNQEIDLFKGAVDYSRHDKQNLGNHIFGPDDGISEVFNFHAGAEVSRVDAITGEEDFEYRAIVVENGPAYTIELYQNSQPSIPQASRGYEFNSDGKLSKVVTNATNQIDRVFKYNDHGKLIKDQFSFGENEPYAFYDYIYEYNGDDKLTYYTKKYTVNSDIYLEDEYFFYYNGPLNSNKNVSVEARIYPNPVVRYLNIDIAEIAFDVTIYDLSGKKVAFIADSKQLDVSELPAGAYIAKINSPSGQVMTKFIKQ